MYIMTEAWGQMDQLWLMRYSPLVKTILEGFRVFLQTSAATCILELILYQVMAEHLMEVVQIQPSTVMPSMGMMQTWSECWLLQKPTRYSWRPRGMDGTVEPAMGKACRE